MRVDGLVVAISTTLVIVVVVDVVAIVVAALVGVVGVAMALVAMSSLLLVVVVVATVLVVMIHVLIFMPLEVVTVIRIKERSDVNLLMRRKAICYSSDPDDVITVTRRFLHLFGKLSIHPSPPSRSPRKSNIWHVP